MADLSDMPWAAPLTEGESLPTSSAPPAHFNKLTPVEAELLALLAEECGELVQIIGKIQRHGLDSQNPKTLDYNVALLHREMGDVRAAMILLCRAKVCDKQTIHDNADDKLERVQSYLHHAGRFAGPTGDERGS